MGLPSTYWTLVDFTRIILHLSQSYCQFFQAIMFIFTIVQDVAFTVHRSPSFH
jgi:hypothetical protein